MYALVNGPTANFDPDKAKELADLSRELFEGPLKEAKGFRGGYLLSDGKGKAMALSLWDSEADMQAATAQPQAQALLAQFPTLAKSGQALPPPWSAEVKVSV